MAVLVVAFARAEVLAAGFLALDVRLPADREAAFLAGFLAVARFAGFFAAFRFAGFFAVFAAFLVVFVFLAAGFFAAVFFFAAIP